MHCSGTVLVRKPETHHVSRSLLYIIKKIGELIQISYNVDDKNTLLLSMAFAGHSHFIANVNVKSPFYPVHFLNSKSLK